MSLELDGRSLSIDDVVRVSRSSRDSYEQVSLAPAARAKLSETRAFIEREWMGDDAPPMYAFNTGVGSLKEVRIPPTEFDVFQEKMILAHATGIGSPLSEEVTRATLLLRANALASNFSGVSVHVVDRLLEFLNRGLHPVMPEKGSVGASGDLAPLAHLAGALCGYSEAEIVLHGERLDAPVALERAGLTRNLELGAKDASALLNGSTVSLAIATLATERARRLLKHADVALALSLEAMRGERAAFDPRLGHARPHKGQVRTADNMRRILAGSERTSDASRAVRFPEERRAADAAPTPRVQDVYSMRCAPQVHGPVADALDYIEGIVTTELNSATDNPLMFGGDGAYEVISGGHFHGQYMAQAMDLLAIAITDLGSISERRVARLIDPAMSYGLPRNLSSGRLGVNTGFATVQCSLSALVMENKTLSTPGSVDSIPGKGNAEDHVSNSTWCARKASVVVDNAEHIVAGELLTAAQALDMVPEDASRFPIGNGSAAAVSALRESIPPVLEGDVWYAVPMARACELLRSGAILSAVEREVGDLA